MQEISFHRPTGAWGCLTSRSPHPVRLDGLDWPSVEHYMLAQRFAHDESMREAIRREPSSAVAARVAVRGREQARGDWRDVRDAAMYRATFAKFTQHAELRAALLDTGSAVLVDHAFGEDYWADGGDGHGQNMLGRTLMAVREELRRARPVNSVA